MAYISDTVIAALRDNYALGIFFRLGTDPALHLAFGVNDIPIIVPSVDPAGTVYQGAGLFLNVPDLEALVNGLADQVTFQINGLSPDFVAKLLDTAPEVLGAQTIIGIAPLDARYQPISQIIPLWTGTADYVAEEMKPEPDLEKNRVMSISLVCSSGDTSRSMSNLKTYSDLTQKLVSPTDRFFERVSRYVAGLTISWPRF